MPQPLASKENSLFRSVVKNYESKQYKKGLKAAEQILRKHPNHGDTQAMKALILNSQGQADEAFALAKIALKNDMRSHVCWHVYGLLYRSVKNYEEAIKAYKFALKIEPDSNNILRDLALLQVQMRDYQGYIQSRTLMLKTRSQQRQNWTGLAVAYHLAGDLKEAEKILVTYEGTLKSTPAKTDIEHSEASLYKNTVIAESGDVKRALDHLESLYKANLDRTAVMELRAEYLLRLERYEEAEKAYRALLDRNNEYREYYDGLERALQLDRSGEESRSKLKELYEEYAAKSERLDAARRIPLDFLEGEEFKAAVDPYLRRMFSKGVPSTFPNIKALYAEPSKKEIIEELVTGYTTEKKMNGSADASTNGDVSERFDQSVLYFLAQHYNYHLSRDLEKATEYIDKALELNPNSVDYNMTKARIWKHLGNTKKATETMEHARQLDEKDRYINTKSAKYQLRDDQNDAALKTMSKFTRNETHGGPLGDLHDMQCMWYITEDGESYRRQLNLGLALKRFNSIYDIFDIWQDDQFDFHSFSLRKGQIRAYVEMVKWEDHLREHPMFTRAAISAVQIYLLLADDPSLANKKESEDNRDPAERKKAAKKARKELEKLEKETAEKKANAAKKAPTGADGEPKKEDPDPKGEKLIQTKQPLEDAMKFLTPLLEFSPKNVEAQILGFEVFIRRNKLLLALKSLLATASLDPENPTLHEQAIRFRRALDASSSSLPPKVSEVITAHFTLIPASEPLPAFNDAFLKSHAKSPLAVHAGLKARYLLDPASKSQNEKDLVATLDLPEITFEETKQGLGLLGQWGSETGIKEEYKEKARGKWPECGAF
ncbi:N-alpha-acetyltransferas-like protein 15 [Lophium mytilinum]|uniref:N-alpha-acetyltransferas-like protein 15 n=1 Tax=Lophium mytilinum TaxID=390894 RepID=A0A6A6QUH1_9PEZI|nr:N-alpha-acetyltransferas-like protein 15 [Lophium mytilinum]